MDTATVMSQLWSREPGILNLGVIMATYLTVPYMQVQRTDILLQNPSYRLLHLHNTHTWMFKQSRGGTPAGKQQLEKD